ncbi:MAG: hypothetical protein AAGI68_01440 [Planctomycetota bacterium]
MAFTLAALTALLLSVSTTTAQAQGNEPNTFSFTFADYKNQNRWDQDESWRRHGASQPASSDGIPADHDAARIQAGFNTAITLNGSPRTLGQLQLIVADHKSIAFSGDKRGGVGLTVTGNVTKSGPGAVKINGYYTSGLTVGGDLIIQEGQLLNPADKHHAGHITVMGRIVLEGGSLQANRLVLGPEAALAGQLDKLDGRLTLAKDGGGALLEIQSGARLSLDGLGTANPTAGNPLVIASGYDQLKGRFADLPDGASLDVEGVALTIHYLSDRIELRVAGAS